MDLLHRHPESAEKLIQKVEDTQKIRKELQAVKKLAREKARAASCLSNAKQLGLAMLMYSQDYDEFLGIYDWQAARCHVVVQPYIKNTQIERCPSRYYGGCSNAACPRSVLIATSGDMSGAGAAFAGYTGIGHYISYAWNRADERYGEFNGRSGVQNDVGICGRPEAYIKYPAETIMFGDGVCTRFWGLPWLTNFNNSHPSYAYHNEGANFCMVDGHAKWKKRVEGWELDALRP